MSKSVVKLEDRLRFAIIDDALRASLPDVWSCIEPHITNIMAKFYEHLRKEPQLASMVGLQQERLMKAQAGHWERLFSGRFDDEYENSARTIGRVHHKIGLEPAWYIGGYKFVLNELTSVIVNKRFASAKKTAARLQALNTAVFLDLDIALSVYQLALVDEINSRREFMENTIEGFRTEAEQLIERVDQVNAVVKESASSLGTATVEADTQTLAAVSASEQTSATAENVASAAEELTSSISEISQQVAMASQTANSASQMTEVSNQAMDRLAACSDQIGSAIEIIQEIAEKTNLLALNATIEAARAGEAGRGFAIVAQEVKALAGQTAGATDQVARQVSDIQNETKQAVDAIRQIAGVIEEVSTRSSAMAAAVEEQNAATSEISSNITTAATGAQQLALNLSQVQTAVNTASEAARTVDARTAEASDISNALAEQIRTFLRKLREGPLNRRMGEDPNYRGPERRAGRRGTAADRKAA